MSYNILCYAVNHEPLHLDDIILYFQRFDNVLKTFQSYFTSVPLSSVVMRSATTVPRSTPLEPVSFIIFDTTPFYKSFLFARSFLRLTDIFTHLPPALVLIGLYYIRIYSFLSFWYG